MTQRNTWARNRSTLPGGGLSTLPSPESVARTIRTYEVDRRVNNSRTVGLTDPTIIEPLNSRMISAALVTTLIGLAITIRGRVGTVRDPRR